MIDFLAGRLIAATPGKAVLDLGGIGVSLEMPPAENDNLHNLIGEEITIYTRLMIREDEIYIYGFRAVEERKLFNLMLSVSGFGPRLALSILGIFSVSEFYVAVLEENIAQLSRAHGVGRKAAQRLILELKEKLPGAISTEELVASPLSHTGYSVVDDITEALCALGYSSTEASTAVSKVVDQHKDLPREELLKLVLKSMAKS